MTRFGTLKTKILQKLSEAYINGDKGKMKEILTTVKTNKDFKDMYLFYEDIENKYIKDKEDAEMFIEEVIPILKEHKSKINKFCKDLDKKMGDVPITENITYLFLDTISENDTLKNAHKKIDAKRKLIEHLTSKRECSCLKVNETESFTTNQNLLHTVLANNFNALYNDTLNEEQKDELKKILIITNKELETNFKSLKEEVSVKMNTMLQEEKTNEVKTKLNEVLSELTTMDVSKFNYYKLLQLKNGL